MNAPAAATVVILGSGTSTGVPLVGCSCPTCRSTDPRDRRLRFGVHVSAEGFGLQIDVSPDFRQQALRTPVERVDAAVLTHCHADHVLGLDDLRRFNTLQQAPIDVWARPPVLKDVRRILGYVFEPPRQDLARFRLYRPRLVARPLGGRPVAIGPFLVRAIPVPHGPVRATAVEVSFRGRRLVTASDCSRVTPALAEFLRGADIALLDGLRDRPHPAHLTFEAAAAALRASGCRRGVLVHIGHDVPHDALLARYPGPDVRPAFDGEVFEL